VCAQATSLVGAHLRVRPRDLRVRPGDRRAHPGPSAPQPPTGPVNGPAVWSDTFGDSFGLNQVYHATVGDGAVRLGLITPLGGVPTGGEILAMAQGSDGKLYLGTAGAHLNVYDPLTDVMSYLGAPVPTECFT
jgi:hypothetical protein